MQVIEAFLNLVYPRHCAICCKDVKHESHYLCWDCLSEVATIKDPFCSLCGNPVDGKVFTEFTCSHCARKKPSYDKARSAARYSGVLKDALLSFKYASHTALSVDFGSMLYACTRHCFQEESFDAVTYVPLYKDRQMARSYNQSKLLAKELAKRMELPVMSNCLVRSRSTRSQTGLRATQRRTNVAGAFRALNPDWIDGRRILMVDDVMTTGATVDECGLVLKDAGAVSVHVVTVARG